MNEDYETFYDDIKELNGVMRITIPFKVGEVMKLNVGDRLKILIKKIDKSEDKKEGDNANTD